MNTIRELTQQEKYDTMLKRKNREIKSLKEQLELLIKDDEKYQETIIKQSKEIERLNNIINETLKRVSNIQHNLEKYEEIGYKHLEYAMDETDELKEYLIKELKENK